MAQTPVWRPDSGFVPGWGRGLMNAIRFKDIEAAHLRIMNLPEQYGGNGMEFWRMTLDCVDKERGKSDPGAAMRSAQSAR